MGRRGTQIAFAVFAAVLTVIGGSKTNSPPDRLLRRIIGAILPPVSSNYPYGQSVWPFDAATSNAVSGLASTIVQPIPDAMAETGVALYRANPDISMLGRPLDVQPILEWSVHDIDNRGVSADLPFAFPFNVRSYTNVGVLSNGRLAFGHATLHRRTSQGLPVTFPHGLEIAAPFWGNHLVAAESGSAVCTIATSNEFAVVWENLVTPEAGLTNTTTVVCRLAPDGRMSWFYSPASPSVTSNVTIGIQSGTNGWMLANGGNPPDMATLLSNGLRLDLVPVGGMEWAVADADGDGLPNYEEFMLGTNPNLADTDGDGPNDKWELERSFSPRTPALSPVMQDTDGDGVADIWESRLGTDPLSVATNWPCADTDGDGFTNEYKIRYLLSDAFDSSRPEWPDTDEAGVLTCSIASDQPCWLVFRYNDDPLGTNEVRIAWVPGISPSSVNLLVDAARPASVALERGDTGGYWSCSLDVDGYGAFFTEKTTSSDEGWFTPDATAGEGWSVDLWRLGSPSLDFDFCGLTDHAEIYLTSLAHYGGTVVWSSCPDGISGIGNPLVFNPSEVAPGTYELTASVQATTGTAEGHYTVHIRALHVQTASLLVDATDTTTHRLPVDDATSFIPYGEDYYIYSEPEGIDSIEFVPADLTPGQRYTVYIWNGDCGYATVTVIAAHMECTPQAAWPNYPRSDLGVGELLNCTVTPGNLNVRWSCTDGLAVLDSPSAASTTMRVLDVPGPLTVTASIDGFPISTNYVVHEPEGIAYSKPWAASEDYIDDKEAGVGCLMDVHIAPTNVAFGNVWIEEGYSDALDVRGLFAEKPEYHPSHDGGNAYNKHQLQVSPVDGYFFQDKVSTLAFNPWSSGGMEWQIPITWWISNGLTVTNYHSFGTLWVQQFEIDDYGTTSIFKFGSVAKRFINGTTVLIDSRGNQ